jgi:hypothetical protein
MAKTANYQGDYIAHMHQVFSVRALYTITSINKQRYFTNPVTEKSL